MSTKKERRKFLIKIRVKEIGVDGKSYPKELSKETELEINWNGNIGKGKEGGEKVIFQDDNGKEYPVKCQIKEIKKGFFRDDAGFTNADRSTVESLGDFELDTDVNSSIRFDWTDRLKGKEEPWNKFFIKPLYWRPTGFILIGIALIVFIFALWFFLWRRKKNKK